MDAAGVFVCLVQGGLKTFGGEFASGCMVNGVAAQIGSLWRSGCRLCLSKSQSRCRCFAQAFSEDGIEPPRES